ncbi:MAG TPA: histidine kinase [Rhodospirillales bacterium]|nr:histidine kinase [Rhodospirillales bacterium]
MTPFKVAHAFAEDWAHAAKACADGLGAEAEGANLGFVYITDELVDDFSSILTYLRQKTGIGCWIGSAALGICAGGKTYFGQPAMAVMAATLPEDAVCVFPSISESIDELSSHANEWIKRASPMFGIVHGDPNNEDTGALIAELADSFSGFLVGGISSSSAEHSYQVAGRVTGGGVSGALFAPEVDVITGLSQGCAPIAEGHVISDCLDNVLIGLDGRRALDVFREDVAGIIGDDLSKVPGVIHAAIPIEGSDTGDYMVRNLLGIDSTRGWLAIGSDVQPGERIMFVRRDADSARKDLCAMLNRMKGRVSGKPRGGVYFSCTARGPFMFGGENGEMALIRQHLGDFPLVGFYASGEISNNRLYSYTGVLVLFL